MTEFEDFNWLTIDRAEQVPAIYFRNVLGSAFYSGKLTDLEPDLVDAIARTLMPSSCEAFFRNNSLPFTHRDYYLSKVYQYAYDALVSGRFCYGEEADRRLTTELEKIPNDFLPRLHETFDVQHFFLWTRPYDKNGGRGLLHSLRLESLLVDVPLSAASESASSQIGERLRALKEKSGLTWQNIADESKVSGRRLYEIANAGAQPSPETRKKLSNFFSQFFNQPIRL